MVSGMGLWGGGGLPLPATDYFCIFHQIQQIAEILQPPKIALPKRRN